MLDHYDPSNNSGMLLLGGAARRCASSPLTLYPLGTSLNYGTTVGEGLACCRSQMLGRAVLFCPYMNYKWFARGARVLCLPPPTAQALHAQVAGHALGERATSHPPPRRRSGHRCPRGRAKALCTSNATWFWTVIGVARQPGDIAAVLRKSDRQLLQVEGSGQGIEIASQMEEKPCGLVWDGEHEVQQKLRCGNVSANVSD
jgi:hypothetical protein